MQKLFVARYLRSRQHASDNDFSHHFRLMHDHQRPLISIYTPVDALTLSNSSFRNNSISFDGNGALTDYLKTKISLIGRVFNQTGAMDSIENRVEYKEIHLKTAASVELDDRFIARLIPGPGSIHAEWTLAYRSGMTMFHVAVARL